MASRTYLAILGESTPPALEELIIEYGKHLLGRGRFYFPSELPADAIATEPKEGTLDRALAIPVEDLYASEEHVGQVGQEGYGATLALLLTTGSFHRWKEIPFLLYCDTPLRESEFVLILGKGGDLTVKLRGTDARPSILRIPSRTSRDTHTYRLRQPGKRRRAGSLTAERHREFEVPGGSELTIEWRKRDPG